MKNKQKGKLVILSAPSGCGKTTISHYLEKDSKFLKSISATTRVPRPDEKHGVDYYFITKEEFQNKINDGKFVEYAKYQGCFYGTPIDTLEDAISKGYFVLLVIEVKGALQIMEKFPNAISIFILPPDMQTLKKRLLNRNCNTSDEINKRLDIALREIKQKDRYSHCVVNDDVNQAVLTIKNIVINS